MITPRASSSDGGTGSLAARGQTSRNRQIQFTPARKVTTPAIDTAFLSRISILEGRAMATFEAFPVQTPVPSPRNSRA